VSSFQDEESVCVTPCQDKYKACFEYVDVAGQFTSRDHELHSENVDALSIKEEISTQHKNEISSEIIIVSSVKDEKSLIEETACCSENTPGMYLNIVDVISIKQEPVDEISITEDPFAVGESEIVDTLLFKREKTEDDTCFTDTALIKEEKVEHCAEDASVTENRNCVPVTDQTASSFSLDVQGEPLIGDCMVTVSKVQEDEKQGYTETNQVFRLVHCSCKLQFCS
jgi:hypothetical protein